MVKIQLNNHEVYFDGYLHSNLTALKEMVKRDWDGVFYVCGYEGSGKTTLASQVCYFLDPNINLSRVVFTAQQFIDACMSANQYECILFDESWRTFTNKAMWEETTKSIIGMLTMIRKKRLFICIVAPTFFDIQKYIALHRSRFLLQVYSEGLERGFFKFYNADKKLQLYIKGRKDYDMSVVMPDFYGRFTNFFPFDKTEYENKKDKAIEETSAMTKKKASASLEKKEIRKAQLSLFEYLDRNQWLRRGAMTAVSNGFYHVNIRTFQNWYENYRLNVENDSLEPLSPRESPDMVGLAGNINVELKTEGE